MDKQKNSPLCLQLKLNIWHFQVSSRSSVVKTKLESPLQTAKIIFEDNQSAISFDGT